MVRLTQHAIPAILFRAAVSRCETTSATITESPSSSLTTSSSSSSITSFSSTYKGKHCDVQYPFDMARGSTHCPTATLLPSGDTTFPKSPDATPIGIIYDYEPPQGAVIIRPINETTWPYIADCCKGQSIYYWPNHTLDYGAFCLASTGNKTQDMLEGRAGSASLYDLSKCIIDKRINARGNLVAPTPPNPLPFGLQEYNCVADGEFCAVPGGVYGQCTPACYDNVTYVFLEGVDGPIATPPDSGKSIAARTSAAGSMVLAISWALLLL